MRQHGVPESGPIEETWRAIESLADEIGQCARDELSGEEFYRRLLGGCLSALAGLAATVWRRRSGVWVTEQQLGLQREETASWAGHPAHVRLLDAVEQGLQPRVALPSAGEFEPGQPANPGGFLLVLCPVVVDGQAVRVIEVCQRPTSDPGLLRAYQELLAALCESAADFQRQQELRQLRDQQAFWEQSQQFARQVHRARSLPETVFQIVNDGRLLLGCDRLSLALRRGNRYALQGASGVERIERRSTAARRLEQLARLVAAAGETFVWDGREETPAELTRVLQPYLDETHVRWLAISPLTDGAPEPAEPAEPDRRPLGMLIAERFAAEVDEALPKRLETVRLQAGIALGSALAHRGLVRRGWDFFCQSQRVLQAAAVLLFAGLLAFALTAIPADFDIQARGELLPQRRQDVFAPQNGEIRSLAVEHDSAVEQGQVLAELSSPQLDLEYERLAGERQTTQQKLLTAQAERGRQPGSSAEDRQRLATWSAMEKELQKQLESLDRQLAIAARQRERLIICSPLSGRVLTWDVRHLLESRPVTQGQVLLTVADVEGPWELEVQIPDHHIRHVWEAQQRQDSPLAVAFVLKTAPDVSYEGELARVSMTTATGQQQQAYVRAIVSVDRRQIAQVRSGAAVVAKIRCGSAPLGYVWLHDLIDAVKTWVLF